MICISNTDIISMTFGIYTALFTIIGCIKLSKIIKNCCYYRYKYYKLYKKKWFNINKYEQFFDAINNDKPIEFYVCLTRINDEYLKNTDVENVRQNVVEYNYIFDDLQEYVISKNDQKFYYTDKQDFLKMENLSNLSIKYNNNHYIHTIFKYKIEKLYNKILNNNDKLCVEIYEECIIITNKIQ